MDSWEPAMTEEHRVAGQVMRGIRLLLPDLMRSVDAGPAGSEPVRTSFDVPGHAIKIGIRLSVRDMARRAHGNRDCIRFTCVGTVQLGTDGYPVDADVVVDSDTNAILELRLRQPVEA